MNSKTKETLRGKKSKKFALYLNKEKNLPFPCPILWAGSYHNCSELSFFSLSPPSKAEDRTQGLVLARQPLYH